MTLFAQAVNVIKYIHSRYEGFPVIAFAACDNIYCSVGGRRSSFYDHLSNHLDHAVLNLSFSPLSGANAPGLAFRT